MIQQIFSKIRVLLFLSLLVLFAAYFVSNLKSVQPSPVFAASGYPSGFFETRITNSLNQPTAMNFSPDGRLFVAEKGGKLRIIKNGSLLSQAFVTIPVTTNSERGLLGVTFDPDFSTNRYVYVYYTRTVSPIKNRVSRFTADLANPDIAIATSEAIMLDNIPSDAGNHQAGAIHFGLDGKLYIAVGDNGTPANAQNLSTLAGKILRISSDGTIPSDNPFIASSSAKSEIWAYGFRNPFTFAVDSSSGKIFINDVGQKAIEEINDLVKGANYGWPTCEGTCSTSGMTNPFYEYSHSVGQAIIGGSFYRGSLFPSSYNGDYFYGDYVQGWIKVLDTTTKQVSNFASSAGSLVGFTSGPDGALYYLTIDNGSVYKIIYSAVTPSLSPTPTKTPTPTPNKTPTPTPTSQFPTAKINSPSSGTTYTAGSTIKFSGSATDPQDGTLSSSALSWTIVFHHDTHTHPFLGPISATGSGSLVVPNQGETSTSVWYRIHLSATDSDGNTNEATRDIKPKKVSIKLATLPPGLEVTLDGQPHTSPFSEQSVVGFIRSIGVITPQIVNGRTLQLKSWSDSGSSVHDIVIPSSSKTYTATFEDVTPAPFGSVFFPTDDAYVAKSSATTNYGSKTFLVADNDPLRYNFLKFDLQSLFASPSAAFLHIKVIDISKGTHSIWFTNSSGWTQSAINYSNRPAFNKSVPAVGIIQNNSTLGFMDIDVTNAVRQKVGGIFSIGMDTTSTDGLKFNSKESLSDKPMLLIQ